MHALIDFPDPERGRERLAFGRPAQVLVAHRLDEVRPVLEAVERQAARGRWCVGFLRYEAAPAFDAALQTHAGVDPLAWFGVHDHAIDATEAAAAETAVDWRSTWEAARFKAALARIAAAIADGEVYQVNLTAPLQARYDGDPRALFAALQRAQPAGWCAYIDTGREQVLSVSPELFFDRRGARLLGRPMKGTAPRGATPEDDARLAAALLASEKERAENLMIVDLIRNDLSRVAAIGSVAVPRLFHLEPLPSVWQMTSDVVARMRDDATLADVFAALFPCGSVTGAPKVTAMRLIRELEARERGVYCGAVGLVRPGGDATFNVPIRTVSLRDGVATCGIGSGITADSTPAGEWAEWRHKRAFVERAARPFELLETMRMEDGRLPARAAHLQRMAAAARHFGYAWREADAAAALDRLAADHAQGLWLARLTLDRQGRPQATAAPLAEPAGPLRVVLAAHCIEHPSPEFLRFKTTRRESYERFAPRDPAVFDTLLWNEEGEITEFTRGNVALRIDGRWVTPPLRCGLLPGIGRAQCIARHEIVEEAVTRERLPQVQALAFINSARGWLPAVLD
ncbi:MAG: aminodeoxychorismate synthase component I [Burkholderiales bacterium]|nr:aminodeoxychorismate synthase component I [Burkholderiales bacterium]MDE1927819.1 aminodeoxychorismate synthase component I [Burkholderiales bacterium]MDE2158348.1 aminodeoxychorismate synthase component I [Burkholderiales bacterium]MDE2504059.1 aminodeoxychorismate synthase component I [Burkholderiales bacterium]